MKTRSFQFIFFCAFVLLLPSIVAGQTRTTVQPGAWNLTSTWGVALPSQIPTAANSDSIIVNHSISVPTGYSVTVDGMRISASGTVTVAASGTLTLANVPTALKTRGTLIASQGSSLVSPSASALAVSSGGTYRHEFTTTEGVIPLATWNANSILYIAGYTTATSASAGGNWGQTFGHVVWNCAAQAGVFDLQGRLDNIAGDFTISDTGVAATRYLVLTSLSGTDQLAIGRDLIISGRGRVNFVISAGGNYTLNTARDISINTTGFLQFATDGTGTINVGRNVDITNGAVSVAGTGTGNFNFNNGTVHDFRRGASGVGGSIVLKVNYFVGVNDVLDLGNAVLHNGGVGTNANTFQLDGTVRLGSTEATGALQNNTVRGNIRTAVANRIFSPGSKIVYNGSAAQFIQYGNGVPTGAGITTIIDNTSGVTLVSNLPVAGTLQLQAGTLFIGPGRTLSINGDIVTNAGFLGGEATSTLTIGGTTGGNAGNIAFAPSSQTVQTFNMTRTGAGGAVNLTSALTVLSQLNLVNGDLNNNGALAMGANAVVSRYAGAQLLVNRLTNNPGESYEVQYRTLSVVAGPFATFNTGLELPDPSNNEDLSVLNINTAQSSDVVMLTQNVSANTMVDLNRGLLEAQGFTITLNGSSWSDDGGNFGYGTSTVVFTGTANMEGNSSTSFYNLRLSSGSNVTVVRNPTLYHNIDFQSGSIIQASTSTFTFAGSANQTIAGSANTLGNITVAKTGGNIQLTSALGVVGLIRFNTTGITLQSNGFLTLLSTTDAPSTNFGTGMIYRLQNSNNVTGNVTVQRYMSGEGRIYRYLSTPVSGARVSGWKDDFQITGDFVDPSNNTILCGYASVRTNPSLFYYDETQAGTVEVGYVGYPLPGTTTAASPIEVGRGYSPFIRQCSNPTIVDLTGPINQQSISLPVTYTPGDATAAGWNLVGNPYPCAVDWDLGGAQGWTKTRIAATIAIRDNAVGVFRYWDGDGDPADIPNGILAVGQGFWVRATAAAPVLTIREGVKVTNTPEFFRKAVPPALIVKLSNEDGTLTDKAYVKIRALANPGLDDFDAPKMDNAIFDLATLSGTGMAMAINAVPSVSCGQVIQLVTRDLEKGTYSFAVSATSVLDTYSYALTDAYTGTVTTLSGNDYTFTVNDDERSVAHNRFTIKVIDKLSFDNVSITTSADVLCAASEATIGLSEKLTGVTYQLWAGGKLLSNSLTLSGDSLTEGQTSVQVRAFTQCSSALVGTIDLVKQLPLVKDIQASSVCLSGEVTLSALAGTTDAEVRWYSKADATEPVFVGETFVTPVLSKTSTYYVASGVAGGCESGRTAVAATVINYDPIQITLLPGNKLSASLSTNLQWYFNDQPIEGAVSNQISAIASGTYTVRSQIEGCTTEDSYDFIIAGIDEHQGTGLFPNPTERFLYLQRSGQYDAAVINAVGIRVGDFKPVSTKENIVTSVFDLEGLVPGVYFVKIVNQKGNFEYYRVIKK